MDVGDILSIIAILFSIFATVYSYIKSTKKYELRYEYFKEIHNWHNKVIFILIEMRESLTRDKNLNVKDKNTLLIELSTLIEVGRFYFPNIDKGDEFGKEKPLIYRGYRNLVLDYLVFSYDIFKRNDSVNYQHHLLYLQRNFTSLIFEIINPNEMMEERKKHLSKDYYKKLNYQNFLDEREENLDIFLLR